MHISLDQALGRQPRLNRVGQSLLNIGSGASAAYSLRSLTGGDPKVVNVRRSADDEEREFTASGVQAELENWVNGKLETTLPADVDTAAAAYSLRKVRSAYTGNAVQIRRAYDNLEVEVGFDGDGNVSDSSPIFDTTEDTDSGVSQPFNKRTETLGEFISAFDYTRLPCDQADAAAAYSLRKVREAYTGNAVKIRRESDDAEADVAFDDNDEVSTSSAITVTSGSSTATTLGEFIDSEKTGRINFASGSNDWLSYDDSSPIFKNTLFGAGTIRSAYNHITDLDEIGASPVSDSDYSFKVDSATGTSGHAVTIGPNSRDYSYTCTFKYYVPVGQPDIQIVYGTVSSGSLSVKGQWEEVTVSSGGPQGHRDFLVRSVAHASTGGIWYLADLNLEISSYNASVVTWYDQSGNNNHATQTDPAKQPKIADGGSLLTDGIEFDGADDSLVGPDIAGINDYSVFITAKANSAQSDGRLLSLNFSNNFSIIRNRSASNGYQTLSKSTASDTAQDLTASVTNKNVISLFVDEGTDMNSFINGSASSSNPAAFGTNDTLPDTKQLVIGANRTTSANRYNGSIDEIVIYNSDQSLNRQAIEKNIGDHYSITTPDVTQDVSVVTWFDQSGNGNDATQDVASSQPLIAQNGSLLTDSNNQPIIDFLDDSVTGFNISNSISPESIFAVVDIKNISGTQRIFEKGGNNGIIIESNQANFRFNNTTNRLVSSASGKQLLTGIDGPSGLTAKNGTEVITSGITTSFDSGSNYRIGVLNFTGTTQAYGGHMYELIIYNSDQSSNRFKIESNINNHYGIYTAAVTGFTVSGTDSEFNSTFGFFGQQQNGKNVYVHAAESTRTIRYSFNGKWELQDDGDIYQVSVDTNKDYPWEVEEWEQGPEGSGGDPVFSDFVIPSQEGFVETWFDQSGNGNDATQSILAQQPKIVDGGSICTRNGKPIIKFIQANSTYLETGGNIPPSGSDFDLTVFNAMHVDRSSSGRIGIFGSESSGNNPAANGGYNFGSDSAARLISKFRDSSGVVTTLQTGGFFADDTDTIATYRVSLSNGTCSLQTFNNGQELGTIQTATTTDQSYNHSNELLIGARSRSDNFSDSEYFEAILYPSNQSANRPAIEANLSAEYGITLS